MRAAECANHFRNSGYAQSQKNHALVFVRLAHDRRFVGTVVFLFFFVLVVFIRISGRHRVAQDHEGTPVDDQLENSSGMCGVMLLLLACGP
jgi:cbb3-type cytochrome oxidase subunit 3